MTATIQIAQKKPYKINVVSLQWLECYVKMLGSYGRLVKVKVHYNA